MRVVTDPAMLERGRPAIMTIGAFDGVHRGHQFLIRQVVDRARRLEYDSVVITFEPRPQVVLRPGSKQLSDGAEKARIISALGPTALVVMPFSREVTEIPAGQFLLTLLQHINLAEIWVGADFAFGYKREGNVEFLIRNGQTQGFAVHIVPRQSLGSLNISSTVVREQIENGDLPAASRLMGHYLRLRGPVVHGAGRGRDLGYPTANIAVPPTQMLPHTGIYAAHLAVDEQLLPAAVSIGYNPQFDGQELKVEAYVLDHDLDLRGRVVGLDLVKRLREEARFESVDALIAQMDRDVEETRAVLATSREPGELMLPVEAPVF